MLHLLLQSCMMNRNAISKYTKLSVQCKQSDDKNIEDDFSYLDCKYY